MDKTIGFVFSLAVLALSASAERRVWLDELDLSRMQSGWSTPKANRSIDGNPLRAGRKKFERGVGTHAHSEMLIETRGNALSFEAEVALDDEQINRGHGSVTFQVYADGKKVADTGVMKPRQPPEKIALDLRGVQKVLLMVSDGGDGVDFDHADWCNAFFTLKEGGTIRAISPDPPEQLGILTPPSPRSPGINGPRVFGVRPGNPLLFTLPVTGERPLRLSAEGVPEGAAFDPETGRLSGIVSRRGNYTLTFTAENRYGRACRKFRLAVGDKIALTPPMGWNSWNCFAGAVSDLKVRQAALAMVKSGLVNHGWSYINIDDYWQNSPQERRDQSLMGPERDAEGKIVCNRRFPDMRALADYVHDLGLKIGIYSSPGPLTCGGCTGSWQHEEQDARSYAGWGFDYLKYDWCSYSRVGSSRDLKGLMKPYLLISRALSAQNRDIVLSLCQYGMGHVSAWGEKAGGQCWRTTGDITDTWVSMTSILDAQDGLELFAGPGAWNDPDMLIVGEVGWGKPHPTRLTRNEQYTHVSLWCMLCSPLLIGCDMTRLDPFTLNLLTNDEVLETNQDPAGHAAARIARFESSEIWAKAMSDGSTVVALVNRGPRPTRITLNLKDLGLRGTFRLRDLWRQQDLGEIRESYSYTVLSHATQMVRLFPLNAQIPVK